MPELNRERIIELLDRLGSEDDADVVQAARTLHGEITAAGFGWDALLTPEQAEEPVLDDEDEEPEDEEPDEDESDDEDGDEDEGEDEDEDEPEPDTETDIEPEAPTGKVHDSRDAESLALIEKLLARRQIGEALRDELNGYKEDIAEGDFGEADRKYVRALRARLSKNR